jgi:hypothetical protein
MQLLRLTLAISKEAAHVQLPWAQRMPPSLGHMLTAGAESITPMKSCSWRLVFLGN